MASARQKWTEGQDKILRSMWLDGKSHLEIARAIEAAGGPHRDRGSIHGRRQRLGLPERSGRLQQRSTKSSSHLLARPTSTGRLIKGAAAPKGVNGAGGAGDAGCEAPDAPQVENSPTMAPGARLVPFLEIQPGECRFVVEEHPSIMCGAPAAVPGGAWCEFHRRLVYVPRGKVAEEIHRINSVAMTSVAQNPTARILQTAW